MAPGDQLCTVLQCQCVYCLLAVTALVHIDFITTCLYIGKLCSYDCKCLIFDSMVCIFLIVVVIAFAFRFLVLLKMLSLMGVRRWPVPIVPRVDNSHREGLGSTPSLVALFLCQHY